ncbi:hypothetical protein HNQ50_000089 [Silvimonas terrae]|uniref:Uncharacterized protein n=1 Tax=Silvimonas terrae TaxID=300266 RepID=A0A840R7S4_9NEIS|nr:hypothetical protein [Silvimonas terrae]
MHRGMARVMSDQRLPAWLNVRQGLSVFAGKGAWRLKSGDHPAPLKGASQRHGVAPPSQNGVYVDQHGFILPLLW